MKALVLTCDKYRPMTEHMLKTYEQLWPQNSFIFILPYQNNKKVKSYNQQLAMVQAGHSILQTMNELLAVTSDDEWIYWSIDDKFIIDIDSEAATYFASYVQDLPSYVTGLAFCRARLLLMEPHVSSEIVAKTKRGDALLRRYNYNQIWLHQFLRARVLKNLFAGFPKRDFAAIEMDTFTNQGPNALPVTSEEVMYVTQENFMALGESTSKGRVTRGCLESMTKWGLGHPGGFEIDERPKWRSPIGSLKAPCGE